MPLEIYFPMTVNILTVGHIKCLEHLERLGFITVGLLTTEALRGYKEEVVPFADRKYILDTLSMAFPEMRVVPQLSLNPSANIKKYNCNAIASGDGWEKQELAAIEKLGIQVIDIKLKGEKAKKYSSSKILNQ